MAIYYSVAATFSGGKLFDLCNYGTASVAGAGGLRQQPFSAQPVFGESLLLVWWKPDGLQFVVANAKCNLRLYSAVGCVVGVNQLVRKPDAGRRFLPIFSQSDARSVRVVFDRHA